MGNGVAQLVQQLLLTPVIHSLNPYIHFPSTVLKTVFKRQKRGPERPNLKRNHKMILVYPGFELGSLIKNVFPLTIEPPTHCIKQQAPWSSLYNGESLACQLTSPLNKKMGCFCKAIFLILFSKTTQFIVEWGSYLPSQ